MSFAVPEAHYTIRPAKCGNLFFVGIESAYTKAYFFCEGQAE
jgi:hypothetical protein